jgi:signal peptidase I
MTPTIIPGTCYVSKVQTSTRPDVSPGDVVALRRSGDDFEYIKRIVAVEGQTVQMKDGRLWIDGASVPVTQEDDFIYQLTSTLDYPNCPTRPTNETSCPVPQFTETLPNGARYSVLDIGHDAEPSQLDNTILFEVPEAHVFVLGDNRDNSNDSRIPRPGGIGFVAYSEIIGIIELP